MKNLYLVLIALLLLPLSGFSQGENDNWVSGHNVMLNFSSGSPVSTGTSAIYTHEGVAAISDPFGNLLFYTDGETVYNKNHQIMPNGCCMTASAGTVIQGVVIVPFPNQPNKYYIFTTNGQAQFYNFMAYSIVDMTADNGLGDVVSLNNPLKNASGSIIWNDMTEGITVIDNFDNYWVLIPYDNKLLAYNVDSAGVNTTPVVSNIAQISGFVHIKVSPKQNYLAISDAINYNRCVVYNFNPNTGKIICTKAILQEYDNAGEPMGVYSSEFSSQNNIIWTATFANGTSNIHGYDLNNPSNPSLAFTIPSALFSGSLQRGPDNEIYLAYDSDYLGKINNSNNLNTANFIPQAVYLGGQYSGLGLPQIITPPYYYMDGTDITLTSPESYSIIRIATNKITTKQNYVACGDDITLRAGNYVEMLPNTFLCADLNFVLIEIGVCDSPPPLPLTRGSNNSSEENVYYEGPFAMNKSLKKNKTNISEIYIYPNPTSDLLYVKFPASLVLKSAFVYDLLGKQTQVSIGENNTIDMSQMASGVYILKLETNQGILTKKVIKQ